MVFEKAPQNSRWVLFCKLLYHLQLPVSFLTPCTQAALKRVQTQPVGPALLRGHFSSGCAHFPLRHFARTLITQRYLVWILDLNIICRFMDRHEVHAA